MTERCRWCKTVHGRPYCCGCSFGMASKPPCPSAEQVARGYFQDHGCAIEGERRMRIATDPVEYSR